MSDASTDEAVGDEGSGGYQRTAVPAPPRPPAPLHDDAMPGDEFSDGVLSDGGPATSAMPPLTGADDRVDVAERGFTGSLPLRTGSRGPATGYTTTVPTVPPLVPVAERRAGRDRRPQVTVRGPRRAKLVIRRVDPWSVLKFSFLFSVCLLIVWVVAASALLSLLRSMHVFDNINSVLASATSSDTTQKGFQINPSAHDVRLWAAIIGAVNALLFTALATLGAFLYNLISILVGGVEVTLGERD
jgi:hypothetical protein